ncbi:NAD dependent epimerase/dehydratase family protein [[Eubacterium] yurii subsp. margaretiae ATCC 43715]|nr:NAD dependent epimerase/dehydratase family protein [[Eubacterium] yurii subsp. margaretiae ATCC 43715]
MSQENLYIFFEKNLILNYNIVNISLKYNVKRFITLGSSCSYSRDAIIPTKETELWKGEPENSYGICKLVLLNHLKSQDRMKWVYLIPPNIYGPDDHFDEENSHLIPATFKKFDKALNFRENSIEVWGDGTQIRDFVYVDDIVDILLQTIEDDNFLFKELNLSTNVGVSVREIVEFIRSNLELDNIYIRYNPDKPTGALKKILDNSSILKIIPRYKFKEFSDGIMETCLWYKKKYFRE